MASRTTYRCAECAAETPKWMGRCTSCGAWDSLAAVGDEPVADDAPIGPPRSPAVPIDRVEVPALVRSPTGVAELDRVLGGGLVAGSVTLLAGEPGIGKSTLTLQLANGLAASGRSVLVISGEESASQVRLRAERLGTLRPKVWLAAEHELDQVLAQVRELEPDVVVLDSIQTVSGRDLAGPPGSVHQVAGCAARLAAEAKSRDMPTILVGHVTKDGGLAGPRTLEHLVDTVVTFEGDRHHALRLLRAVKHRFGSTDELGVLEMTGNGLEAVSDPSSLFLADRRHGISGSVVVSSMEGHRPLLVEVQALASPSQSPNPRRSGHGIDSGRFAMVSAVLSRRTKVALQQVDLYGLAVGGVRVAEPAADLAIALAVASSMRDVPFPPDTVVCGEVGLGGEIRQVQRIERRLAEAVRLGFTRAMVPVATPTIDGIELVRVVTLKDAVEWMASGAHLRAV